MSLRSYTNKRHAYLQRYNHKNGYHYGERLETPSKRKNKTERSDSFEDNSFSSEGSMH